MKVIGITGGVGSGKSTVTKILEDRYHAYLINTDQIAHLLMKRGGISYQLIVEYFGDSILDNGKEINRQKLANIVYKDKEKLKKLNSFSHPYVMDYVLKLIEELKEKNINYVCVETALPIEAGLKDFCDQIWVVYAPDEVRKERLKRTRNYSDEKIEYIIRNQLKCNDYKEIGTHTIMNNCSIDELIKQVDVLLEK